MVPTTAATRADEGPSTNNGTEAESNVSSISVITFNDVYQKLGVVDTLSSLSGTIKVSSLTTKILVVINPDDAVSSAISSASTFSDFNAAITEEIGNITADNNFLMVSSGVVPGDHGLTDVSVYSTISAAQADPVTVNVDRVAAKVTLTDNLGTQAADTAKIIGWQLNATNKKYYPYSERIDYEYDTVTTTSVVACYREDPNYTDLVATDTYGDEFNWYSNQNEIDGDITWEGAETSLYCHENTMEADAQLYGNTTKALVKAQYIPHALNGKVSLGTGYFRVDGVMYTIDEIEDMYDSLSAITSTSTYAAIMVGYMQEFYGVMDSVATAKNLTWNASSFSDMVITELDAIPNAGYFAKTVSYSYGTTTYKDVIDFFPLSYNYYYVNIKHDYRVPEMELGRWGVVRNNWYTLRVNSISGNGYPYIPDPTDPVTPDPDPSTPDDEYGYITVDIEVNPWTTWAQDVDL